MLQAVARRFIQWFHRPVVPLGDLADETWGKVGPLPAALPLGREESDALPLAVPPPIPLDARPPKTAEESEWETLLHTMLAPASARPQPDVASDPPPPPPPDLAAAPVAEAPPVAPAHEDDLEWAMLIARAKAGPPLPAPAILQSTRPTVVLSPPQPDQEEEPAWQAAIARAKAAAAREAATRKPARPQTGSWTAVIAAAKRRHGLQPQPGEWTAAIAAAKRRHGVQVAA
jgi:hypothetical protein